MKNLIAHAWALRSAPQAGAFFREARFASIAPVCCVVAVCIKHTATSVICLIDIVQINLLLEIKYYTILSYPFSEVRFLQPDALISGLTLHWPTILRLPVAVFVFGSSHVWVKMLSGQQIPREFGEVCVHNLLSRMLRDHCDWIPAESSWKLFHSAKFSVPFQSFSSSQ